MRLLREVLDIIICLRFKQENCFFFIIEVALIRV